MYSDGFNKVRTEQLHRAPTKIDQNVTRLHKKLLYFFNEAPGRRWHVKKKRKKFLKKGHPCLMTVYTLYTTTI